jgi:hypothetical protein
MTACSGSPHVHEFRIPARAQQFTALPAGLVVEGDPKPARAPSANYREQVPTILVNSTTLVASDHASHQQ